MQHQLSRLHRAALLYILSAFAPAMKGYLPNLSLDGSGGMRPNTVILAGGIDPDLTLTLDRSIWGRVEQSIG